MMFSKYNSMNDIMSYPNMKEYLKVFYSEYLLDMYPKELYDFPVAYIENIAQTPWLGEPFSIVADQFIDAVNLILDIFENKTKKLVSIWNENDSWSIEKEKNGDKDSVFLVSPVIKDDDQTKPAVIICPGGGYEAVCFSGEGTPVMKYMEAQSYRAFILKYRTAPMAYPNPQEDLTLALKYVRANAEKYKINPNKVIVIGASAGGHLCASQAALYETLSESVCSQIKDEEYLNKLRDINAKPNALCLSYPVISFVDSQHEGSALNLVGTNEKLRNELSAENLVSESYPPTFIWTCNDDDCVPPKNTVLMSEALKKAHVKHELHIYETGGHGCALAFSKSAKDWTSQMIKFMSDI